MKIQIGILFLFIAIIYAPINAQQNKEIPILKFDEFEQSLHYNNDTTYVINFWATWCVPCRKELPEFEKIHQDNRHEQVKVILVSLDFPNRIETAMIPFLEEKGITAEVLVLNDPNSNAWINKVNPNWTGALPATVIYKQDKSYFFEEELDYQKIKQTIEKLN